MSSGLKSANWEFIKALKHCHLLRESWKVTTLQFSPTDRQAQAKPSPSMAASKNKTKESFLKQSETYTKQSNKKPVTTEVTKSSFLLFKFTTNPSMISSIPMTASLWKWDGTNISNLQSRTCLRGNAGQQRRLWSGGTKVGKIKLWGRIKWTILPVGRIACLR